MSVESSYILVRFGVWSHLASLPRSNMVGLVGIECGYGSVREPEPEELETDRPLVLVGSQNRLAGS